MSGAMCPHCGWNFESDKALEIDGWVLTPNSAFVDGVRVQMTSQQAAIIYAVAKAFGKPVSREAIMNRVSGSEGGNLIDVQLCRLRKALGPKYPLANERGVGLYWRARQAGASL